MLYKNNAVIVMFNGVPNMQSKIAGILATYPTSMLMSDWIFARSAPPSPDREVTMPEVSMRTRAFSVIVAMVSARALGQRLDSEVTANSKWRGDVPEDKLALQRLIGEVGVGSKQVECACYERVKVRGASVALFR